MRVSHPEVHFDYFMAIIPSGPPVDVPASPARRRWAVGWWVPLLLAAVIFSSLLYNNRQYLFDTKIYETGDWAADSLLVRDAQHGFLLHGHYSRWAFYHPGPALLDTLAVGEAIFYDWLHLVPTPFNGQCIALCLAMALFFSFALSIFARRLGPARGGYLFFLPIALFLALWHYGAARGAAVFLDSWPANPPILVFLCFIVAVASTAAGGGRELPVLVVAGGWLVHNYVAQPLFVVPLTLLAYGGLLAACRRLPTEGSENRRGLRGFLAGGWRVFPRPHRAGLVLLALFILPLAVDALHGRDSNLYRILDHLRTHHEPTKKLMRAFCYFLTFGAYGPYDPTRIVFGHYSAAGMLAFVSLHWQAYTLWVLALLGAPALFFLGRRRRQKEGLPDDSPAPHYFVPWYYVTLAAAFGLTLVWGMKQDGELLYFNAYFDYSIYFGAALALAAGAASALAAWTASAAARKWRFVISALLWLGVVGGAVYQAEAYHVGVGPSSEEYAMVRTIERAVTTLPECGVCFLDSHGDAWTITVAVALEIERLGYKVRVNDNWEIMYGRERTIQHEKLGVGTGLARWLVVPISEDPARLSQWPLLGGFGLDMKEVPTLNPAGQVIDFSVDGNYTEFGVTGWAPTGGTWTWSDQRSGLLAFRPLPLPASATGGVDLVISAWTAAPPGQTEMQRAVIEFNGAPLTTIDLPLYRPDVPPVHVRITAEQWQQAVAKDRARLRFFFPDAKSPASLGFGTDSRLLGGNFHRIEFQPVPAPPPAAVGTPSGH